MNDVFRDHSRELLQQRYVYAVVSRRSGGLSIGVNLNPDKACNFACPYCQVDRTVAGAARDVDTSLLYDELVTTLGVVKDGTIWGFERFRGTPVGYRSVKDIAIAGDGEPTACAQFLLALGSIERARTTAEVPSLPVVLLTNATLIHRARVRYALRRLDAMGGTIWAKLDAGTDEFFHLVDGTKLPFTRILRNLEKAAVVRPIVIQSLFFQATSHPLLQDGPRDAEIEAWVGRLQALADAGGSIREVQVTTVARKPTEADVQALPNERLEWIAAQARAAGFAAKSFP